MDSFCRREYTFLAETGRPKRGAQLIEVQRLAATKPCTGLTNLFFAPDYEDSNHRAEREAVAKAMCFGCDLLRDCQEEGILEVTDSDSVYGGLTPEERKDIRRLRGIALQKGSGPHGTPERKASGCTCSACRNAEELHHIQPPSTIYTGGLQLV